MRWPDRGVPLAWSIRRKLFAGNLSYNIDDATIVDFFKDCGELVGLRWLTRKDTEEFRVSVHCIVFLVDEGSFFIYAYACTLHDHTCTLVT